MSKAHAIPRWIALLTLPTAALAGPPPDARAQPAEVRPSERPPLLVVKLHADWCAGCRALGDLDATLAATLPDVSARYVTLDVSDRAREELSRVKARALGIEDVFARQRGRVGVVLAVDPATGAVLETWTVHDGHARMREGLRRLAAR